MSVSSNRSFLTLVSVVIAVIIAIAIAKDAPAQSEAGVQSSPSSANHARAEYHQSLDTPDGIAFRAFLNKLTYFSTLGRDDAIHSVVDSFKLTHDAAGTALAASLFDHFEVTYQELAAEISAMEKRTMCPPGRRSRTKAKILESFNNLDDRTEKISERHFRKIEGELTADEFERLVTYLQKFKGGLHYVKIDFASLYEFVPVDQLAGHVEQACAKMDVRT